MEFDVETDALRCAACEARVPWLPGQLRADAMRHLRRHGRPATTIEDPQGIVHVTPMRLSRTGSWLTLCKKSLAALWSMGAAEAGAPTCLRCVAWRPRAEREA